MLLRPTEQSVLRFLDSSKDSQGITSESLLDIGLHIGRSVSATRNALNLLETKGIINKIRTGKKLSKGVYQLTPEGVKTLNNLDHESPYRKAPSFGLSDLFRTPYFSNAGRLHQAAPKGHLLTLEEVIKLGVVRTRETATRYASLLSDLPAPLLTVTLDPSHHSRKLYEFHELTKDAERINLEYVASIPGATVKTFADHAAENKRKRAGYAKFMGLEETDNQQLYDELVKPFIVTDPEWLGCEVFTGELTEAGYGTIRIGRTWQSAHRIAWLATAGWIPPGNDLHHMCGNRRCASVFHLLPVSREIHRGIHQGDGLGALRMPIVGNACRELEQAA